MENAVQQKHTWRLAIAKSFLTTYLFITKYLKIYYLFIILFAHTGLSKLLSIGKFQYAMWKTELLKPYYKELSYAIPLLEIITAVLLAFPIIKLGNYNFKSRTTGLYLSLLMMAGFTTYLGYSLLFFSDDLPCTCGGVVSAMTWNQHLIFNILFTLLAARAIYLDRKYKKS